MHRHITLSIKQQDRICLVERLAQLLTETEQRVAFLATQGYTSKQIAARLGNRPRTVERHIESITIKAKAVYGRDVCFRNQIVPELYCYYFLTEDRF